MINPPRFEVRWSNGAWKLFDTHWYSSIDIFGTAKEAWAALARKNK